MSQKETVAWMDSYESRRIMCEAHTSRSHSLTLTKQNETEQKKNNRRRNCARQLSVIHQKPGDDYINL